MFDFKKESSRKGFTLIELLVVIAIVGLLSSVILTSLNTARAKARDAVRIHDLRQIQSALQLYWDDWGQYPTGSAFSSGDYNPYGRWIDFTTKLSGYIDLSIIRDPLNDDSTFYWPVIYVSNDDLGQYWYWSTTGEDYDLVAKLERPHHLNCDNKDWEVHEYTLVSPPVFNFDVGQSWCMAGREGLNYLYSDHKP